MDKAKIFEYLDHLINSDRFSWSPELLSEASYLKDLLHRGLWQVLTIKEKQEKRVVYLSELMKRNNSNEYLYYEHIVNISTYIPNLVEKIESKLKNFYINNIDINLLRAYVIMLIEKSNLDYSMIPKEHVRIDVFTSIVNNASLLYPDLGLRDFLKAYTSMYKLWSDKPNTPYDKILESQNALNVFDVISYRYSIKNDIKNISVEEIWLIFDKSSSESWKMLDPYKRQEKRKWALERFGQDPDSRIKLPYYSKMIDVNNFIINIFEGLKYILIDGESIKNAELGLLRICAILQIEKDYMDEDIVPTHHLHPRFIENLAREYHETYPDLRLTELSQTYTEMYELWPEKPDQNQ